MHSAVGHWYHNLILLFFLFVSFACQNKQSVVNIQINWKSNDPQSIPLVVREKEYQKRNLVSNSSFENGRFLPVDSARTSFSLSGWTRLGENVYWTDVRKENEFARNEASDGFHAIKISREKSDETDIQGEGIISDYIKIIPGNYRLSCDIRLENLESNMRRFSGNLIDAVNIRLYFYDRNKILIRNSSSNPAGDNIIDNSFKAFSLSGFDYVRELEWTRINCISTHFPFEEGDVPSDARFVRIFAGLKGTGIMWLDMIDFRYTDANFSLLEKCEPYFTEIQEPAGMLLPSPLSVSDYCKIELNAGTEEQPLYPVIMMSGEIRGDYMKAVEPLRRTLESLVPGSGKKGSHDIRVITKLEPNIIESGRLIFSIGNTRIFNENAEHLNLQDLKKNNQAYLIRRLKHLNNLVFVYAENPEGYYYASNLIKMLVDHSEGIYHHYNVSDYPAFESRGFIVRTGKEYNESLPVNYIGELISARMNCIYAAPYSGSMTFRSASQYYNIQKKYFSTLRKEQPFFRYGFSSLDFIYPGIMPEKDENNLYARLAEESARTYSEILNRMDPEEEIGLILTDHSLWEFLRMGSPALSNKLLDFKHYQIFMELSEKYFSVFNNSLKNPGSISYLSFLPVFCDNLNLHKSGVFGRFYFKDHPLLAGGYGKVLWKGPAEYSFSMDEAEIVSYRGKALQDIVWFDNTLMIEKENLTGKGEASMYPGKARLGSFFAPFNVNLTVNPSVFFNSECIVNLPDFSVMSQIRLETAADFLWNPADYNAARSLWKVLVKRFGKETAIELIRFNDICYKLLYITMTAETEGGSPKLNREGEEAIRIINFSWDTISKMLEKDIPFLNQLTDKKNQIINRFNQSKRRR